MEDNLIEKAPTKLMKWTSHLNSHLMNLQFYELFWVSKIWA